MSNKDSGFRRRSLLKLSIVILICMVAFSVPVLFAAFFVSVRGELNLTTGGVLLNYPDSSYSVTTLDSAVFINPGDEQVITTTLISDSNSLPMKYKYKVRLDDENSSRLQDAILVYFNDEFIGMLTQICNISNGYIATIDTDSYILPGETLTDVDSFKFVLHNAADGSYYDNNEILHEGTNDYFTTAEFTVYIDCATSSINYQEDIFVTSESEFKHALDDINASSNLKTIRLADSITLTDDYVITKGCTIDLFGNTLTFNGGSIEICDEEDSEDDFVVTIDNSRGQSLSGSGTGITLNSTYGALNVTRSASPYGSGITITDFNKEVALELIKEDINDSLSNGIQSGDIAGVEILPALRFYIGGGLFTITPDSEVSYSNFVISCPTSKDMTSISELTISTTGLSETIGFKVIGDNRDDPDLIAFNDIVAEDLKHLNVYCDGSGIDNVYFNVFLPTSVKRYNASITWWSNNDDLMTNDGVVNETAQGTVRLTATIKINDNVYIKEYDLYACKQSEEMLFQYLLATIGTINLDAVYTLPNPAEGSYHYLPIVNENSIYDYRVMYTNGNDIRLDELTYGPIESIYYYTSLDYESVDGGGVIEDYDIPFVLLNQTTFQVYAQVPITGSFYGDKDGDGIPNDEDEDYEPQHGYIGVRIFLGDDMELQDRVYSYIQNYLDTYSVLNNILATRATDGILNESGDFSPIVNYMGFSISYSVPTTYTDAMYTIDNNTLYFYPEYFDVNDCLAPVLVSIAYNGLNPDYDPEDPNSSQYISITTTRSLNITIPGAVHINSSGFNDSRVFYSVKLQVLEQLAEPATLDGTNYINDETTYEDIVETGNYILRYDINSCKTLKLNYGTSSDILPDDADEQKYLQLISWAQVIDWATAEENFGQRVSTVVDMPDDYDWFMSDGLSTISDAESLAITKFCERFDNVNSIWRNYIYVQDNELTDEEISSIKAMLLDMGYSLLIDWATGDTTVTANSVLTGAGYSTSGLTTRNNTSDGLSTISESEQAVILEYCSDKGYTSYESVWRGVRDTSTTAGYRNYCINLNKIDETLSTDDKNSINTFIKTEQSVEGANGIVEWARSTSVMTFNFNGYEYTNDHFEGSTSRLGNKTNIEGYISDNEFYLLQTYLVSIGCYGTTATQDYTSTFSGWFTNQSYYTGIFSSQSIRKLNETSSGNSGTYAIFNMVRNAKNDANISTLLDWATSTQKRTAGSRVSSLSGTSYANVYNNSSATISEDEQAVILYYAQNLATNQHLTRKDDATLQLLIDWATGSSRVTARSVANVFGNNNVRNNQSDGTQNITANEWAAIYYYYRNATYTQSDFSIPNFENEWNKYVNLNVWDNKLSSQDLLDLIASVESHSNIGDLTALIDWMRGFGEDKSGIEAGDVTNLVSITSGNVSDGLPTISEEEYATLLEFIENYSDDDNVIEDCLDYIETCIDLEHYDRVFSDSDSEMLLGAIREARLHGDFYNLVNWAQGVLVMPAYYKVPSLPSDIRNINCDGTSTITSDEMSVLIGYCYDVGYTRLAKYLEDNGLVLEDIPELIRYYYIDVPVLNGKVEAIKYFTNLRRLVVNGSDEQNIFTNTNSGGTVIHYGDNFFTTVTKYIPNVYWLTLSYCNISDVSQLVNLQEITHIDVKGNSAITDISVFEAVNLGNMQYFNIYGTSVDFYYSECSVANLYFEYKNNHSSGQQIINLPVFIYESNGLAITYTPPNGLTEKDLIAMSYCFLLKEITNIDSEYMQLPNHVYVIENGIESSYEITWAAVSGSVDIMDIGGGSKVIENVLARNDRVELGEGIVSATISVTTNNVTGTYTRYFYIDLTNPNF